VSFVYEAFAYITTQTLQNIITPSLTHPHRHEPPHELIRVLGQQPGLAHHHPHGVDVVAAAERRVQRDEALGHLFDFGALAGHVPRGRHAGQDLLPLPFLALSSTAAARHCCCRC
jgi:uncharacterized protein YwbE